jgi:ribosomal protein S18 acetylase RimI-like enzyme
MKDSKITIRPMQDEDLPMVSRIVCAGYRWLGKVEGYTPEETRLLIEMRGSPEAIANQRRDSHFIVAVTDNEIVGMASIRKNEIMKLYIDPNRMRQGIGSALFKAAEHLIADAGYSEISLGAFPSGAKFYEAMGMQMEGERVSTGGPLKGRKFLAFRKKLQKM